MPSATSKGLPAAQLRYRSAPRHNLTRGPDGRYSSLHGAPLYRAAKTAGYLCQAHLRALISERLGLEWGPVRKGAAELSEVPEALLEEFSKRRHEMLREAQTGGIGMDSKASAESLAIATRDRTQGVASSHRSRPALDWVDHAESLPIPQARITNTGRRPGCGHSAW
jgi:TrwC relaxase